MSNNRKIIVANLVGLSKAQLDLMYDSLGDETSWAKHTSDPMVNYAVDCYLDDDTAIPWVGLSSEDKAMYSKEIKSASAYFTE